MTQTSDQDKKSLEDLHQQANECFILGDVQGARSIWQAILQVDPTDRVAKSRLAKTAPEGAAPATASSAAPVAGSVSVADDEPMLVPTSQTAPEPLASSIPTSLVEPDEDGAFELDLELDVPEDTGIVEEMAPAADRPDVTQKLEAPPWRQEEGLSSVMDDGGDHPAVPLGMPAPAHEPPPASADALLTPDPAATVPGTMAAPRVADPAAPDAPGMTGTPPVVERPAPDTMAASASDESHEGPVTSSGVSTPESEGGEATVLVSRARQALAQGRLDEAISLASRALAISDGMVAAQRILEGARAQAGRRDDEVERALNEGIAEYESGRAHAAIPLLEKVLELMPGHLEAEEYLEKARSAAQHGIDTPACEEGPVTAIPLDLTGVEAPEDAPGAPLEAEQSDFDPAGLDAALAPPPAALDDLPPPPELGATGAPLPPPSSLSVAGSPAAAPGAPVGKGRARSGARSLPSARSMLVVLVAVVALGGGGWWLMRTMGSTEPAPATPIPLPQRADAAPGSAGTGTEAAQAATERDSEAPGAAETAAAEAKPTPAPSYTRDDVPGLVRRAEAAVASGREAEAVTLLKAAQLADPSNFRVIDKLDAAQKALETRRRSEEMVERGRTAFEDGMFEEALRVFYRVPETHRPANLDAWIAAGWYNLGVRALQAGAPPEAVRYFSDAIDAAGQDQEAARHREVARRYRSRAIDDAYRIYAANVRMRKLPRS